MTKWQEVYGSQDIKPAEIDSTSSKFYVYQRRNVERVTFESEFGASEMWKYDERKLTREEYAQMKISALEEENTQLQLALVDLYEKTEW